MAARPGRRQIQAIVETVAPGDVDLLIVARDADDAMPAVQSYEAIKRMSAERRAGLGIAFGPRPADVPALSRMRDALCERVALWDVGDWPRNELLALGFVEMKSLPGCFLYDPAIEDQPREWNNPSNWANPENFDKYRW